MTATCEQEEQQLSDFDDVATDGTHEDETCISHAVHVGIFVSELCDGITRVGGNDTETDDENDCPSPGSQ